MFFEIRRLDQEDAIFCAFPRRLGSETNEEGEKDVENVLLDESGV